MAEKPNPYTERQPAQMLDAYRPPAVTEVAPNLAIPIPNLGSAEPFPEAEVAASFAPRVSPDVAALAKRIGVGAGAPDDNLLSDLRELGADLLEYLTEINGNLEKLIVLLEEKTPDTKRPEPPPPPPREVV